MATTPPVLSNRQVVERFWSAMHDNDFPAAGRSLHPDFLLEWPQSGECIRGPANFVAVNQHYPAHGAWRVTLQQLVAEGERVVSDVTVSDGVVSARAITFSTLRDGLIWRQTEFWPDPFPAANWRAAWVESCR